MYLIKFSHVYKKMPVIFSPTFITKVYRTHYNALSEEFLKWDTETRDGQFYDLPKTDLLVIELYTEGHQWQTLRRWTPEKEKFYRSLIGKEVGIEITGK